MVAVLLSVSCHNAIRGASVPLSFKAGAALSECIWLPPGLCKLRAESSTLIRLGWLPAAVLASFLSNSESLWHHDARIELPSQARSSSGLCHGHGGRSSSGIRRRIRIIMPGPVEMQSAKAVIVTPNSKPETLHAGE